MIITIRWVRHDSYLFHNIRFSRLQIFGRFNTRRSRQYEYCNTSIIIQRNDMLCYQNTTLSFPLLLFSPYCFIAAGFATCIPLVVLVLVEAVSRQPHHFFTNAIFGDTVSCTLLYCTCAQHNLKRTEYWVE